MPAKKPSDVERPFVFITTTCFHAVGGMMEACPEFAVELRESYPLLFRNASLYKTQEDCLKRTNLLYSQDFEAIADTLSKMKSVESLRIAVCNVAASLDEFELQLPPIVPFRLFFASICEVVLERARKRDSGESISLCGLFKLACEFLRMWEFFIASRGQWRQPDHDPLSSEDLPADLSKLKPAVRSKVIRLCKFLDGDRSYRERSQTDILSKINARNKGRGEDWSQAFDWLGYFRKDLYAGRFRRSTSRQKLWRSIAEKPSDAPPITEISFKKSPWGSAIKKT